MTASRIVAFRLLCPDVERTARFYEAAFGCGRVPGADGIALALGRERIELAAAGSADGAPAASNATTFQHFAMIVSDMTAAMARLEAVPGWTAISRAGPEHLPAASGGVTAFKFRDPDGHPLEFLQFPPGAAPAAWAGHEGLVLGIDHSAISVADTERAIAFYGELGFAVATRQVNRGAEQARMDGVASATVEVTGLAAGDEPPHLELLCYREPAPVVAAVADDHVLATRILLSGAGTVPAADPDGHRLAAG